jgi:hypothetical protein
MCPPGEEGDIEKEGGIMVVFDEEGFEIQEDSDEEDERPDDQHHDMAEEYKTRRIQDDNLIMLCATPK